MTTMQIRHLRDVGSAGDSENAEPIVLPESTSDERGRASFVLAAAAGRRGGPAYVAWWEESATAWGADGHWSSGSASCWRPGFDYTLTTRDSA